MTLEIGDAPVIPGLSFRQYRGPDDHPGMLRVYNAAHEGDGVDDVSTLEQFALNYATLVNCDPLRDILIAEVGGEAVAYARVFWTDQVEGGRSYENFGFVHPKWRRRGIGGAMHRHNEERLLEIAAEHVDVSPKWLSSESMDSALGNVALLERSGYTPVRYFYDMVAPSLEGTAPSGTHRSRPSVTTGARRSRPMRTGSASRRPPSTLRHHSGWSAGTAIR